jgi:hypothetical protein
VCYFEGTPHIFKLSRGCWQDAYEVSDDMGLSLASAKLSNLCTTEGRLACMPPYLLLSVAGILRLVVPLSFIGMVYPSAGAHMDQHSVWESW